MSEAEARDLIAQDPRNAEVLFPYVNGEDLNSRPDSSGSRWVINFFNWSEDRAKTYPACYEILLQKVKRERERNNRDNYRRYWWRFGETRPGLVAAIADLSHVLAITLVSRVVMPVRVPTGQVLSNMLAVFATEDLADLALLSSAPHYWWAISHASTMRNDLRYTPSDVFETLARPQATSRMQEAGTNLDADRRAFMLSRKLGLTKPRSTDELGDTGASGLSG